MKLGYFRTHFFITQNFSDNLALLSDMKIVAPILLLLYVLTGCKRPESFEYRDVQNFKIDSLGFEKSTVSMDLIYFNPNNFGVNLKSIDCDVYVEHNYLGKYILDTTMHIAKRSEFTVPSHMQVDMRNLFKNTLNSFFSNELLLEVKGTTRLGKGGIYITVPFTYSGRQKLNLFN
jgi:LEA14-like dessication related protein